MAKKTEKERKLEAALNHVNKTYKSALVLSNADEFEKAEAFSTTFTDIDDSIGCGGLPKGRVVELFGPETSGKTWLALKTVVNALSNGSELCGWLDVEQSFPYDRLIALSKNNSDIMRRLKISKNVCSAEMHLDTMEAMIRSGAMDIVVLDSTAALSPQAELDGSLQDNQMALLARMLSKSLRQILNACASTNATAIFINQVREKVGVMYGNPETTPGGRALKFYSSVRLRMELLNSADAKIIKDDKLIGGRTRVRIVKSRFGPPALEPCIIPIYYSGDPDIMEVAFTFARIGKMKVISKRKNVFKYDELTAESESLLRTAITESNMLPKLCDDCIAKAKEINIPVPVEITQYVANGYKDIASPTSEEVPAEVDENVDEVEEDPEAEDKF